MSVVWVHEINRQGTLTPEERQYLVTYEVHCDENTDTEVTALGAAGIPRIGDQHPQDAAARCLSVSAKLRNERDYRLYTVDAEYTSQMGEDDVVTQDPNTPPDLRVPELEVEMVPYEDDLFVDLDGKPLRNTAGQFIPYEQRLYTRYRAVIKYRRWWSAADFDIVLDSYAAAGKVNASEWRGIAARSALITRVFAQRMFFEGRLYYQVDYEIALADSWKKKVYSEGFLAKPLAPPANPADHEFALAPIRFADEDNPDILVDAPEPVPLDIIGNPDPDGVGVELEFRVYEDADFTALGL
jgi:hypothetical protein